MFSCKSKHNDGDLPDMFYKSYHWLLKGRLNTRDLLTILNTCYLYTNMKAENENFAFAPFDLKQSK